jgi:hypothetical protein
MDHAREFAKTIPISKTILNKGIPGKGAWLLIRSEKHLDRLASSIG